jgi:hypothetical protein
MESHEKKYFEVKVFSPLRILTSPLFEETRFFKNFFSNEMVWP